MEVEEEIVRRIPVLGHIPLLGFLFTDRQHTTAESELVFIISPSIVSAQPRGTSVPLPEIEGE